MKIIYPMLYPNQYQCMCLGSQQVYLLSSKLIVIVIRYRSTRVRVLLITEWAG